MRNYYSIPFVPGTRKLTLEILNNHSAFRAPKIKYVRIWVKEIEYINEWITVRIRIEDEEPELVYLKVTESALLVSCSVDTDQSYLSRSAYFALKTMVDRYDGFDFEYHYWPDFINTDTGLSKFLVVKKMQGRVVVYLKARYHGFYKPGHDLPLLLAENDQPRRNEATVTEDNISVEELVVGYCLADTQARGWSTNHWPFLIPYTAALDKNKTAVKSFKSFVTNGGTLFLPDLDPESEVLNDICFEMRKIALMDHISLYPQPHLWILKDQIDGAHFKMMFSLWQEALPILTGRLYLHYYFTYGMKNIKGKPRKRDLQPCQIRNEVPELCFVWKEFDEYYKIELRFKLGKKICVPSEVYPTTFFANTADDPGTLYLLNSVTDCQVMNFFQKTGYRLLIMKPHLKGQCKEFIDQLRIRYKFV